jgi:hypothetical protein
MIALIAGELAPWPTKERLAEILRAAGLRVRVGRYSVRVEDCSHFAFQDYGGDISEPTIEADADTVEDLMREARLVSDALARADIRHRFEIYDDAQELAGYLHYRWPLS